MDNIIEPSDKFDFSKLNLENPIPLPGGNFFTKLNFTDKQLPLLIQLPKCNSKHGIVRTQSSKKMYTDLLFNYFENGLITWLENLELKCRELIFEKKDIWFQTEMDLDDIEAMFISPTKSYKSGKLITVRAYIPSTKQIKKNYCLIYDENEINLEASSINETTKLIPLINIEGIRFSSKSFQLEINLRQLMVLSIEDEIKKGCLINRNIGSLEKTDKENNKEIFKNYESSTLETNLETNDLKNNIDKTEKVELNELSNVEPQNIMATEVPLPVNEKFIEPQEVNELPKSVNIQEKLEEQREEDKNIKNDKSFETIKPNEEDNKLCEVELSTSDIEDNFSLKKPNEVYLEIYKIAREKAKHMKQATIEAYLEARNIKTKYMLDELNASDDELSISSEFEE